MTTLRRRWLVAIALCAAGCSTPASSGGPGTGGVSASGGDAGAAGGGTSGRTASGGAGVMGAGGTPGSGGRQGGGGLPATGGASASGGLTGTGGASASGGRPGSGGTPSLEGTGGGGSGAAGAPGSGGEGGAAGAAPGGSGDTSDGGQGGSADPLAAAGVLDGFALLKPCFSAPGSCAGCTCDENPANLLNTGAAPENQHVTKQFGGDATATYDVKLRVVGVAERYWYTGGMLDASGMVFYTGGSPTIHSAQAPNANLGPGQGACKIHPPQTDASYPIPFTVPAEVAPADNCYNGFNIFAMTVSSPRQTYFLNYTTDYDGVDRQPHAVYKTDYTVTIPISGQAQLDFYVIDGDHHQVANTTMTVPNVKNAQIKQPYSGNFLELEVVDVTRAPPR